MLAANAASVAAVVTAKGSCGHVVVWNAHTRRSSSYDTPGFICGSTCAGAFIDELALGAGSVAWIASTGGNTEDLLLFGARLPAGKVRQLDAAHNGNGAGEDQEGDYIGGSARGLSSPTTGGRSSAPTRSRARATARNTASVAGS